VGALRKANVTSASESEIAAAVDQFAAVHQAIESGGYIEQAKADIAEVLFAAPATRHKRGGSAQRSRRQSEKAAPSR
jgi:hypothetical protein